MIAEVKRVVIKILIYIQEDYISFISVLILKLKTEISLTCKIEVTFSSPFVLYIWSRMCGFLCI